MENDMAQHDAEYHDALLLLDPSRFAAECEYCYDWNFADGQDPLHVWRCRECKSDIAGPPK